MMIMLLILGELSRRLGEVLKVHYGHRWFYVSAGLTFLSIMIRLGNLGSHRHGFDTKHDTMLAFAYIAPLSIGLIIGIVVAWRYWGWLIYASEFSAPPPKH
jgi:hypothetical protein